jgi:hypothetical protein
VRAREIFRGGSERDSRVEVSLPIGEERRGGELGLVLGRETSGT